MSTKKADYPFHPEVNYVLDLDVQQLCVFQHLPTQNLTPISKR